MSIVLLEGVQYFWICIHRFPGQLLAVLFCFGYAIGLPFFLYQKKKIRVLTIAAELLITVMLAWWSVASQKYMEIENTVLLPESAISLSEGWNLSVEPEEEFHIAGIEGNFVHLSALNHEVKGVLRASNGYEQITIPVVIREGRIEINTSSAAVEQESDPFTIEE